MALDGAIASAAIASGAMALEGAIASPAAIASGAMALEGAIASPAAIASGAMALDGAIASADMASAEVGGQAVEAAIASAANTGALADSSSVIVDASTIIEVLISVPFFEC